MRNKNAGDTAKNARVAATRARIEDQESANCSAKTVSEAQAIAAHLPPYWGNCFTNGAMKT